MFASRVSCVASKRILRRMKGHPRTWPATGDAPDPLVPQWPLQPLNLMPSGWAPATGAIPEGLPFRVFRTKSLQLPVYTDYKNGRTRVITQLRKYGGDVEALREELSRILGGREAVVCNGRIEVQGNVTQQLKTWLMGLGF